MDLAVKSCKISDLPVEIPITDIYLLPDFLTLLVKYFHYNVNYLLVTNRVNGDILAVTATFEKKLLGIPSIINPQIIYYQPLEYFSVKRKHKNETQLQDLEIQKQISAYYHKYYFKIEKNLSPNTIDVRGFNWSGLKASPLYTYVFDLKSYSSDIFFRKQRASLRKAQKLEYQFTGKTDIDSFLSLVEGTKKRQDWNFNIPDKTLKDYISQLLKLGFVKQFSITNQKGKIVSTMFCLMDKVNKVAYAWLASTDVQELSKGVSTLLFHSISEYLQTDYDVFDLCGANTDTIARFKASLGAELKVFYRIKL